MKEKVDQILAEKQELQSEIIHMMDAFERTHTGVTLSFGENGIVASINIDKIELSKVPPEAYNGKKIGKYATIRPASSKATPKGNEFYGTKPMTSYEPVFIQNDTTKEEVGMMAQQKVNTEATYASNWSPENMNSRVK